MSVGEWGGPQGTPDDVIYQEGVKGVECGGRRAKIHTLAIEIFLKADSSESSIMAWATDSSESSIMAWATDSSESSIMACMGYRLE